jgi:hypothetical protein
LQAFCPLHACFAGAAAGVVAAAGVIGAALPAGAAAAAGVAPVAGGGVLSAHPPTPSTIPETAAAIRLSVSLMMFVPFFPVDTIVPCGLDLIPPDSKIARARYTTFGLEGRRGSFSSYRREFYEPLRIRFRCERH